MSELAATPGVIPYVDYHDGPRRLVTIVCEPGGLISGNSRPVVSIDGRAFQVMQGPVTFEVPADRNVHIGVHVTGTQSQTGLASTLLEPGGNDESFMHRVRSMSVLGELTRIPPYAY